MSEQTPKELLTQIRSFIATAKAHLAGGGDVDMTGLDGKVRELCDRVLDMPKPEADAYAVEMEALVEELDALKIDMVTAQAGLRQQIEGLNLRHKAAKAYTTSEAMPTGTKTDTDKK